MTVIKEESIEEDPLSRRTSRYKINLFEEMKNQKDKLNEEKLQLAKEEDENSSSSDSSSSSSASDD